VDLWQVLSSNGQAPPAAASTMSISQVVINGQVKLCSPGCSSCSTGACTGCLDGYTFDYNSATCFICAAGCSKCDALKSTYCT